MPKITVKQKFSFNARSQILF